MNVYANELASSIPASSVKASKVNEAFTNVPIKLEGDVDISNGASIEYQNIKEIRALLEESRIENVLQREQIQQLSTEIEDLTKQLVEMKIQSEVSYATHKNSDESYSDFISITLAGATFAITFLGILIAVLALIGIRQLKVSVTQKAIETARKKTESLLQEEIRKGEFDNVILDSIEMIAMRGVQSGPELESNNNQGSK